MAWAYPILKLGIQEDLRGRLQEGSAQYVCFAAVLSRQGTKDNPTLSTPKVTGTVELAVRSAIFPGSSRYAYISNLAVSPFYRRQGIARKLLANCEPAARAWGFREIYLHVLENNDRARKLYTSSGYRLHRIESSLFGAWLKRPRRLLLRKSLLIIDN
nr:GNAT family N-acetyltransferase [Oscillatoria sp. FACHB-1406]